MEKTTSPNVGVSTIIKTFWKVMKPQKDHFYYNVLAHSVASIMGILTPVYYKKFFDLLSSPGDRLTVSSGLVEIVITILILNCIAWFFNRTSSIVISSIESNTMARMRQQSFDYLLNNSYSFFANNFTGSLVQKVNRFARAFEKLYDTLMYNIIPLTIYVVGVISVVYWTQPVIAYVIMVWTLSIMVFGYFFSVWKLKYNLAAAKADTATGAQLADSITNHSSITSFTGFGQESKSFREVTNNQAKIQNFNWNLDNIVDATQSGFIVVVEFFIFYYAIKFWQAGTITIGTFVLIQVYILGLAGRLWGFNGIIKNLYECFADSKEMVEILETPHDIVDRVGAKALVVDKGEVEFKDVHFSFNENKEVLGGINLKINQGEKIALIGPSGAGKSTTIKLLLRLYDLKLGSILIDGQNIKEVTQESLHKNVSLVPQDPILFHRSLMENIRYGREGANDEEVIEAAKLAHCSEFIESLPLKYETLVGERGIKLSGGERQRIAIARAILKNAPILVLDEATSSLDSHSESLIQDALGKLMENKTSIVIAHRLSTIRKMDRVIVVDGGRVSEEGTHDELLKNEGGLYKKLWNLQAGGFLVE